MRPLSLAVMLVVLLVSCVFLVSCAIIAPVFTDAQNTTASLVQPNTSSVADPLSSYTFGSDVPGSMMLTAEDVGGTMVADTPAIPPAKKLMEAMISQGITWRYIRVFSNGSEAQELLTKYNSTVSAKQAYEDAVNGVDNALLPLINVTVPGVRGVAFKTRGNQSSMYFIHEEYVVYIQAKGFTDDTKELTSLVSNASTRLADGVSHSSARGETVPDAFN